MLGELYKYTRATIFSVTDVCTSLGPQQGCGFSKGPRTVSPTAGGLRESINLFLGPQSPKFTVSSRTNDLFNTVRPPEVSWMNSPLGPRVDSSTKLLPPVPLRTYRRNAQNSVKVKIRIHRCLCLSGGSHKGFKARHASHTSNTSLKLLLSSGTNLATYKLCQNSDSVKIRFSRFPSCYVRKPNLVTYSLVIEEIGEVCDNDLSPHLPKWRLHTREDSSDYQPITPPKSSLNYVIIQ